MFSEEEEKKRWLSSESIPAVNKEHPTFRATAFTSCRHYVTGFEACEHVNGRFGGRMAAQACFDEERDGLTGVHVAPLCCAREVTPFLTGSTRCQNPSGTRSTFHIGVGAESSSSHERGGAMSRDGTILVMAVESRRQRRMRDRLC